MIDVGRTRRMVSIVVVVGLGLALMGTSGRALAVTDQQGCDDNQTTNEPGPTDLTSKGTTHFQNSSINTDPTGPGDISWNIHAKILPPNTSPADGDLLRGFLNVRVVYENGDEFTFLSSCVDTVHTSVGHLNDGSYRGGACFSGGGGGPASRPQGASECAPAIGTLQLDRLSPRRANLHFEMVVCCIAFFELSKNNAVA